MTTFRLSCCKPPSGLRSLVGLSLDTRAYWGKGGPHLKVSFCEPTLPNTQARFVRWMNQWGRWCNCSFALAPGDGQIRVSLIPGQGFATHSARATHSDGAQRNRVGGGVVSGAALVS